MPVQKSQVKTEEGWQTFAEMLLSKYEDRKSENLLSKLQVQR